MSGKSRPPHGGTPAPTPAPAPAPKPVPKPVVKPPALTHSQQSAFDLMKATLTSWGLAELAGDVRNLIVKGDTDQSTLALALSQTDTFKKRFAGNAARMKAGLPELNPAQYLAVEEAYRETAKQYGVPAGYLDKSTTDKMIGGGVSPAEAQDRIQAAADLVWHSPPEAQKAWDQFYGGGQGGAIAAILDPSRAAPLVERQAMAAQIGGAALSQGLSANASSAERFAGEGVTLDQARRAYSDIASRMSTDTSVGNRFGSHLSQADEEAATIEGNGAALQKQQSLYAQEASLFGGRGGATSATADQGSNY